MAKAASRPLVYVADEPDGDPTQALTPERIKAAARRHPGVFDKVRFAYGADPKQLAEAEIVLGVAFDPLALRAQAPKLRWIQSLNAGVEKQAPKLDRSLMLTNASGLHGPKGGEFGLTCMLLLNHAVQRFIGSQRRRHCD